jgi:hypothetical protein
MSNQYSNNFRLFLSNQDKNKSIEEILNNYKSKSCSYKDLSVQSGFKVGTVRKWCHRYNVRLVEQKDNSVNDKIINFMNSIKSPSLDKFNILSRAWVTTI